MTTPTPAPQSTTRRPVVSLDAATRANLPGGSIETLYDNYYATDRKKEWYEIGAESKAVNISALCKSLGAKTVLDIGAGDGALLQRVHDAGIGERLSAVEISDSGLAQLNERKRTSMPRLAEVRKFDGVHVPFPDDAFDLAILSHVIEHVEHPRLLLYEARRVARYLYAEVPLEDASFKRNLHGDWILDDTGHINYYTRDTFKRLLQTAGWKPLRIHIAPTSRKAHTFNAGTKGGLAYTVKSAALKLAPRMAQRFFVYHCATLSQRTDRISIALGDVLPPYDRRDEALR